MKRPGYFVSLGGEGFLYIKKFTYIDCNKKTIVIAISKRKYKEHNDIPFNFSQEQHLMT